MGRKRRCPLMPYSFVLRDAADLIGGLCLSAELVVLDAQSLDMGDGDVQMCSQVTVLVAEPVGGLSKFLVVRVAAGVIEGCGGAHLVDHVGVVPSQRGVRQAEATGQAR